MPEKVPLWVVQNTFGVRGGRMVKMVKTLPEDLKVCATCLEELYDFQDWHYCNEKYYCTDHIQDARRAQTALWEAERITRKEAWERGERHLERLNNGGYRPAAVGMHVVPKTEAEVPKGNLDEGTYQYWIGEIGDSPMLTRVISARSVCRACGAIVHGALGREIHKKESTKFYKAGYSCMKVIADAIRSMAHLRNCLVCKGLTSKKHYGVPICSPNCHKIWRFAEKVQYEELEMAIMPYWASTPDTPATGGSTILESSLSQTPIVLLEGEEE